eukprot:CAMPEP_0172664320 /NCGR_PEP_ID=MMETSP1074-20121228/6513_1 /TAXON_ID=2916 /ORGANISM="Ceratium fusus, Strain PA161109" /LENGTH=403 /DNA_ID=CAMNT_0013480445 /DNA_START=22 /DNA_END=1230 /DNA_ORIENTATION=+
MATDADSPSSAMTRGSWSPARKNDELGGRCRDGEQESGDLLGTMSSSHTQKQDTVIVFDWDDTILPTSWLERIHVLAGGGPLRPEVQRALGALSALAAQTMQFAATLGTVVLITNSAPGWVDQSCQLFMPQMLQQVRSYPCYAKPMHSPLTFKIGTFRRECRQYRNIVSIGDGDAERSASLRLQAPPNGKMTGADHDPGRHIKSVKLLELPTCQQLIVEHEMLQVRLADISAFQGNLDLRARLVGTCRPESPVGTSKEPTCTLVHFARPAPAAPVRGVAEDGGTRASHGILGGGRSISHPPRSQLPPLGDHGSTNWTNAPPGLGQRTGSTATHGDRGDPSACGPASAEDSSSRETSPARLGGSPANRMGADATGGLWKVQGVGNRSNRQPLYHHGSGPKRKPP